MYFFIVALVTLGICLIYGIGCTINHWIKKHKK